MVTDDSGFGYVTSPIYVHNGRTVLYNFPYRQNDSLREMSYGLYTDSSIIRTKLYRTHANDFRSPKEADWYLVWDTVIIVGQFKEEYILQYGLLHHIDNISDASLISKDLFLKTDTLIGSIHGLSISYGGCAGCEGPNISAYRRGSVTLMGLVNASPTKKDSVNPDFVPNYSTTGDSIGVDSVLYYIYMVTYYDSVNHIESDSGRSVCIMTKCVNTVYDTAWNNNKYFKLELPPLPGGETGLWRIVYKALGYKHIFTTTKTIDTITTTIMNQN